MNYSDNINKELLKCAGIEFLDKNSDKSEYYVIYWPDGSLRWIYKVNGWAPGLLAFYPTATLRAKLGAFFIRFVGLVGLMGLFYERLKPIKIVRDGVLAKALIECECDEWALFAGTPGIDRKVILSLSRNGKIKYYLKVAISENSISLLSNEFQNLKLFNELNLETVSVPEAIMDGHALILNNLKGTNTMTTSNLKASHINGLAEIYLKSRSSCVLADFIKEHNILATFIQIKNANKGLNAIDTDKVNSICDCVLAYVDFLERKKGTKVIELGIAHRDFTPWNSFYESDKLLIIDFEFAKNRCPLGYDLFHFIFQNILMANEYKGYKKLIRNVEVEFEIFNKLVKSNGDFNSEILFSLYFILQCQSFLLKYIEQDRVHEQVLWQVDCWYDISNKLSGISSNEN